MFRQVTAKHIVLSFLLGPLLVAFILHVDPVSIPGGENNIDESLKVEAAMDPYDP